MPGPVFLAGDRVTLHAAAEEDVEFIREHTDDPRMRAGRSVVTPMSPDDARHYLGGTMGRDDDTLGLLVRAAGEPVGYVMLIREKPNDATFRRGELAYWVARGAQGNGYATAASRLLIDHAFDALGLHKVTAKAFETNEPSRRVLEKLEFTEEGRFRAEAYVEGEWVDYVRYGLLADEWAGQAVE